MPPAISACAARSSSPASAFRIPRSDRLRRRKIALYPAFFDTLRLNRPLWDFCCQFRAQGGRVWIVSTGSRENIENAMRHLGIGGPVTADAAGSDIGARHEKGRAEDEARSAGWTAFWPVRILRTASLRRTVSWRPCAAKGARRVKR